MFKRLVNFVGTLTLLGAFGFVFPLMFARRITLIGLLVCIVGFALALFGTGLTERGYGATMAVATWGITNFEVVALWVGLVFHVSAKVHRERPAG